MKKAALLVKKKIFAQQKIAAVKASKENKNAFRSAVQFPFSATSTKKALATSAAGYTI